MYELTFIALGCFIAALCISKNFREKVGEAVGILHKEAVIPKEDKPADPK